MSAGRAGLTRTVVVCALGSAVSVFSVTRTWAVQIQAQPAPLAPAHLTRAGTHFVPWVSALGLVGLAGTGALLATRGRWRSLVGAVLVLAGLGVTGGGVYGLVAVDHVRAGWPLLCVPAGLLLAAGGALATLRGADWPAMGTRYERRAVPRPAGHRVAARPEYQDPDFGDPDLEGAEYEEAGDFEEFEEAPAHVERSGPSPSEIAMWDALDRGEDPSQ